MQQAWPVVFRLGVSQAALTLLVAGVWWLAGGSAPAALLGGGVVTVLSLYFAVRLFSVDAATDPQAFLRRLYRAEVMKLVLVAVFFLFAAHQMPEQMAEIVTAFIVALLGYWFALLPLARRVEPPQ